MKGLFDKKHTLTAAEVNLASELMATFPNLSVAPATDYSPDYGGGLWTGAGEEYADDGTLIYDYYLESDRDEEAHPILAEILEKHGAECEPADPGTIMIIIL